MRTEATGAVIKLTLFQCPCSADALNGEQRDGKTRKKPPPHHLEIAGWTAVSATKGRVAVVGTEEAGTSSCS
jgi:hypothetical protein